MLLAFAESRKNSAAHVSLSSDQLVKERAPGEPFAFGCLRHRLQPFNLLAFGIKADSAARHAEETEGGSAETAWASSSPPMAAV